jgi:hypothetical protein
LTRERREMARRRTPPPLHKHKLSEYRGFW